MTTVDEVRAPTPWHLWAVGLIGLAWNAYGAFDYFMSKTQGAAYFEQLGMTPAQIEHYNAMPVWMTAVWAIGVWGAVLGSVLLLGRSRLAAPIFIASLLAYAMSLIYAYLIDPVPGMNTPQMMAIQGVILAACLFFAWYAMVQSKAGVLR